MNSLPRNVFRVCPDNVQEPPATRARRVEPDEYKISRASDNEILRIVRSAAGITKKDLMKAAKCAKLKDFKVYKYPSCMTEFIITEGMLPIKCNVYLTKAHKITSSSERTRVFHICDHTTVAPRRGTPPVPPAPVFSGAAGMTDAQKRTVSRAIHGFNLALAEMKKAVAELERLT